MPNEEPKSKTAAPEGQQIESPDPLPPVKTKDDARDTISKFIRTPQGEKPEADPVIANDSGAKTDDGNAETVKDGDDKLKPWEKKKEKGSFLKNKIEENRELKEKAERAEQLEKEVKERDDRLSTLSSEIEQLKSAQTEAGTKREAKEIEDEIEGRLKEKDEILNKLTEERDALQKKVAYFDFRNDPNFVQKYEAPIAKTHANLMEAIGEDRDALATLDQALRANQAMLAAQSDEDRTRNRNTRDQLFSQILQSANEFQQGSITTLANKIIGEIRDHHQASTNWEQERQRMQKEQAELRHTEEQKYYQTWESSYDRTKQLVEEEFIVPSNVEEYMKEHDIDADTSDDDRIASSITRRSNIKASPDEVNRVIHQGRMYRKAVATIKAMEAMLKEKDEYISGLSGSDPNARRSPSSFSEGGGDSEGSPQGSGFTADSLVKRFGERKR